MKLGLGLFLSSFAGGDADMALIDMFFGDGSDGDVTISTTVTLARDMFYRNLTLAAGASVDPAGFRICVSDTFDVSNAPAGAIACNGNDAPAAVATAAGAAPTQRLGATWSTAFTHGAGFAGGTAAGTAGAAAFTSGQPVIICGPPGGTSGTGGAGGNGSSGSGGSAPTSTAVLRAVDYRFPRIDGVQLNVVPGSKGGSGGGDGTAGGGSGAGGGHAQSIGIFARRIVRSSSNANAGIIQSKGGRGGNGGTPAGGNRGGGGAGSGAGGGHIYILCYSLEGTTHANALDVSGGAGGTGGSKTGTGTDGQGGQAGYGGRIQVVNISANTVTVYDGSAVGGNANSGVTGGASTAAQTSL